MVEILDLDDYSFVVRILLVWDVVSACPDHLLGQSPVLSCRTFALIPDIQIHPVQSFLIYAHYLLLVSKIKQKGLGRILILEDNQKMIISSDHLYLILDVVFVRILHLKDQHVLILFLSPK